MKLIKIYIFLCFIPSISFAENMSIVKTNYSAGGSYTDFKGSGYSVNGRVAAPIGKYVGAEFNAGYNIFDSKGIYLDSSGWRAGGEIFIRDNSSGKAGIGYIKTKTNFESTPNEFEIDSDIYNVNLNYFINNYTLGVIRSFDHSKTDDPSVTILGSGNGSNINATYYHNNFKVKISAGGMDNDDTYTLSLAMLPDFMKKKASLVLVYNDIPDDHRVSINFNYYFTDSVSFMERDRRY